MSQIASDNFMGFNIDNHFNRSRSVGKYLFPLFPVNFASRTPPRVYVTTKKMETYSFIRTSNTI
jgi:hypothetical protein